MGTFFTMSAIKGSDHITLKILIVGALVRAACTQHSNADVDPHTIGKCSDCLPYNGVADRGLEANRDDSKESGYARRAMSVTNANIDRSRISYELKYLVLGYERVDSSYDAYYNPVGYVVVKGKPVIVYESRGDVPCSKRFHGFNSKNGTRDIQLCNCGGKDTGDQLGQTDHLTKLQIHRKPGMSLSDINKFLKSPIQILPSRLPPPLEKLLERIQNYFSTYNHPELQNRPYAPQNITGTTKPPTTSTSKPFSTAVASTEEPVVPEITEIMTEGLQGEETTEEAVD